MVSQNAQVFMSSGHKYVQGMACGSNFFPLSIWFLGSSQFTFLAVTNKGRSRSRQEREGIFLVYSCNEGTSLWESRIMGEGLSQETSMSSLSSLPLVSHASEVENSTNVLRVKFLWVLASIQFFRLRLCFLTHKCTYDFLNI